MSRRSSTSIEWDTEDDCSIRERARYLIVVDVTRSLVEAPDDIEVEEIVKNRQKDGYLLDYLTHRRFRSISFVAHQAEERRRPVHPVFWRAVSEMRSLERLTGVAFEKSICSTLIRWPVRKNLIQLMIYITPARKETVMCWKAVRYAPALRSLELRYQWKDPAREKTLETLQIPTYLVETVLDLESVYLANGEVDDANLLLLLSLIKHRVSKNDVRICLKAMSIPSQDTRVGCKLLAYCLETLGREFLPNALQGSLGLTLKRMLSYERSCRSESSSLYTRD